MTGNTPPANPQPTLIGEGGTPADPARIARFGAEVIRLQEMYPRISDDDQRGEALGHLQSNLFEIARDSSGSDPALYASPEDQALYAKIAKKFEGKSWPGATPITHVETTHHWLRFGKKPDPVVRDEHGKPIVGYRVGYLNAAQFEAPVLFCSDGKLRMLIKHADGHAHGGHGAHGAHGAHDKRTFSGYGKLPDPKLVYPIRTRGARYAVSYNHGQTNTLKTELQKATGVDFAKVEFPRAS